MASNQVKILAKRFSIDYGSAEEYLSRVRQKCRPNNPKYEVITKVFFREKYTVLPEPEVIARIIKNEVARIIRNKNIEITGKGKIIKTNWRTRQKLGYAKLYDVERPGTSSGREPGVVSHNKLDDERVSRDKLGHCPHGVPKGMICALCDPEEYKRMTGIE